MGIYDRLKKGANRIKKGLRHIHEESRYPGRPASYNATDNPLWADDDVVKITTGQAHPPRAKEAPGRDSEEHLGIDARTDRPWFLDGEQEDEGWDGTNPGEAWKGTEPSED